jgi:hypothetical protein
MKIGPLGFLGLVATGWTALRVAMLWPETSNAVAPANVSRETPRVVARVPPGPAEPELQALPAAPSRTPLHRSIIFGRRQALVVQAASTNTLSPYRTEPPRPGPAEQLALLALAPTPSFAPVRFDERRFSLSAWALVRSASASTLATGGQLGGSQAGMRARVRLDRGLHAAARLSTPLSGAQGAEAAIGVDWRPAPTLPITLTVERRIGLDRGGRDAFAAGAFGGFDQVPLPAGFKLDGYGQAGVVGLKRRDMYVDGAVRAERRIAALGPASIAVGAGVWGGAQPGASRLDLGPQIVVRVPVAHGGLRLGAEWRQRVAGNARPGSSPALSLGADF